MPTLSLLCPGSWHHIQNLDCFFTKISFVPGLAGVAREGPSGPALFLPGGTLRVQWVGRVVVGGKAHHASGLFLDAPATSTATTRGTALPVSCWRMSSSWGEMLVPVMPAPSSPPSPTPMAAQGPSLVGRKTRTGLGPGPKRDYRTLCRLRQFVFIVAFTTFLLRCVDYDVLFANQPNNRTRPGLPHSKVTLSDAILPSSQCAQR